LTVTTRSTCPTSQRPRPPASLAPGQRPQVLRNAPTPASGRAAAGGLLGRRRRRGHDEMRALTARAPKRCKANGLVPVTIDSHTRIGIRRRRPRRLRDIARTSTAIRWQPCVFCSGKRPRANACVQAPWKSGTVTPDAATSSPFPSVWYSPLRRGGI